MSILIGARKLTKESRSSLFGSGQIIHHSAQIQIKLDDMHGKMKGALLAILLITKNGPTSNLVNIKQEMLPDEVMAAIGAPDHVSSESTGKKRMPFYFGSDTRRVSWSYSGVGYVVFSRNEYNGELRVFETKADGKAP